MYVACVSCCSESQGCGEVMVAQHGHRGMGCGKPVAERTGMGAGQASGQPCQVCEQAYR